ncbi:MAG: potassium channel family protein [Paludibacteraceae bacterium]
MQMKFIIIGLGHFGAALGERLTQMGHHVVGVDKLMNKVDAVKETFTHAVCLDSTDPEAIKILPLSNSDVVVVCIGENEGENLMTTALLKKLKVKRLISRSVSTLHENVLEAMGVVDIVRPEIETADRWALKLCTVNYINLFEVTKQYNIVEIVLPEKMIGRSVLEINFNKKYNIIVLTRLKQVSELNKLGVKRTIIKAGEIVTAETVFEKNDILVVYGHKSDIKRMIDDNE